MQASFPLRRRGPLFDGKRKKNIRFSWRGRETVSWLKRHAQPSEFPPGFTSWRRGCCQGRTHKILKTHKVSGPCWNCPPGGALKTHEILKTHKVGKSPAGRDGQEKQVGKLPSVPVGQEKQVEKLPAGPDGQEKQVGNCPSDADGLEKQVGKLPSVPVGQEKQVGKLPAGPYGQEKQVGKCPSDPRSDRHGGWWTESWGSDGGGPALPKRCREP